MQDLAVLIIIGPLERAELRAQGEARPSPAIPEARRIHNTSSTGWALGT